VFSFFFRVLLFSYFSIIASDVVPFPRFFGFALPSSLPHLNIRAFKHFPENNVSSSLSPLFYTDFLPPCEPPHFLCRFFSSCYSGLKSSSLSPHQVRISPSTSLSLHFPPTAPPLPPSSSHLTLFPAFRTLPLTSRRFFRNFPIFPSFPSSAIFFPFSPLPRYPSYALSLLRSSGSLPFPPLSPSLTYKYHFFFRLRFPPKLFLQVPPHIINWGVRRVESFSNIPPQAELNRPYDDPPSETLFLLSPHAGRSFLHFLPPLALS